MGKWVRENWKINRSERKTRDVLEIATNPPADALPCWCWCCYCYSLPSHLQPWSPPYFFSYSLFFFTTQLIPLSPLSFLLPGLFNCSDFNSRTFIQFRPLISLFRKWWRLCRYHLLLHRYIYQSLPLILVFFCIPLHRGSAFNRTFLWWHSIKSYTFPLTTIFFTSSPISQSSLSISTSICFFYFFCCILLLPQSVSFVNYLYLLPTFPPLVPYLPHSPSTSETVKLTQYVASTNDKSQSDREAWVK